MATKAVQYNIKVDLHEVKDLSFRENVGDKEIVPNPYIEVTVDGVTKATNQKTQVVSATFNTSFNFTAFLTPDEFARSYVEVSVLHKYMIIGGLGLQSAIIGKYVFSFAYIYSKSQHWIYRQWVSLRNFDHPQDAAVSLRPMDKERKKFHSHLQRKKKRSTERQKRTLSRRRRRKRRDGRERERRGCMYTRSPSFVFCQTRGREMKERKTEDREIV